MRHATSHTYGSAIPAPTNGAGRAFTRRLVVFETPSADELLRELSALYPASDFELRPAWECQGDEGSSIPVWYWEGSAADFEGVAGWTLRSFVYPLVAGGTPYVVSFAFGRDEFTSAELDTRRMDVGLDMEDVGALLTFDAVGETFAFLPRLHSRTPLTPIEERLNEAFQKAGVVAKPQVRFGAYTVDFLIEANGSRLVVEADGRGYHDADRDAERDGILRGGGLEDVIRFTGSEIFCDPAGCAAEVKARLQGMVKPRPSPRRQPLDSSQETAVSHHHGPARVLAPAGSGKTRVLVNRIAALVDDGFQPSRILALAFNKKANEQLVDRLSGMGIPVSPHKVFDPREPGVRCVTFNAYGYRLLKERAGLTASVEPDSHVWHELMSKSISASRVELKGTRRGSNPVAEFMRALDRVRADLALPEETLVELEYLNDDNPRPVAFLPIYNEFQRGRLNRGRLAFDDQIFDAMTFLLANPKERAFVQSCFEHVLVDEYQDLNAAQLALVDLVSRPWRNLFVVGDDDQLIYEWRFAKLSNILAFHERMPVQPHSKTYVLSTNYRCSRAIVHASKRVIAHNHNRVAKDIQPAPSAPAGEVTYFSAPTWQQRASEVIRFVKERKESAASWSEIAVLCRYKAEQPFVAMALDQAGIPRTPLLTYRLFTDRNVVRLRTYLQLVHHPESVDGDSLAKVINMPNRFVKDVEVARIAGSARPWKTLGELAGGADPDDFRMKHLREFKLRVESLNAKYRQDSAPLNALSVLDEVVASFDLVRYWTDERRDKSRDQDEADMLRLLDLIRTHAVDCKDTSTFLARWDENVQAEQRGIDVGPDDLERENTADDRVVIGTMHSSKGREYDSVVLYEYDPKLAATDGQIEEERRVFYVGLTRARNAVLLTIDANQELHQFLRESIAPIQPDEPSKIARRKAELFEEQASAVVAASRERKELGELVSGRRRERLVETFWSESERRDTLGRKIREIEQEIESMGVWGKLVGRRSNATRQLEDVQTEFDQVERTCEALDKHITVLRDAPELYVAEAERKVADAEALLRGLSDESRALERRLVEIELIAT